VPDANQESVVTPASSVTPAPVPASMMAALSLAEEEETLQDFDEEESEEGSEEESDEKVEDLSEVENEEVGGERERRLREQLLEDESRDPIQVVREVMENIDRI
jgi:hypothetical protein